MSGLFEKEKMIIGLLVLCFLAGAVPGSKIHEQMSPAQRKRFFHTSGENVPEYELVTIRWPTFHQRRGQAPDTEVVINAFGEDIKLTLNPTDGFLAGYNTPIYIARKTGSEHHLDKYPNLIQDIHTQMFEDFEHAATLVVSNSDSVKKNIFGRISRKNLIIKPLPENLREDIIKRRKLNDNTSSVLNNDGHYHVVFKAPNSSSNSLDVEKTLLSLEKKNSRHTFPDIVYPEILVVVDNDMYQTLGANVWEAIPYLLAFWNGVDMKYRSLNNPKWRLNIAGIVLCEVSDGLSYVEYNKREDKHLVVDKTIIHSGSYWYLHGDDIPVQSYDVLTTMTSRVLCYEDSETKECEEGTLGVAWVSCACKVNNATQSMSKVSVVYDDGAYEGIHVAAHELGHLFGAMHDGNKESCTTNDGYIMAAYPMATNKSSFWSRCSIENFQTFLETDPTCLYNKPIVDEKPPRLYPGKYLDADKQCQRIRGTKSCDIGADTCRRLKCLTKIDNHCEEMGPPSDGTKCGDNSICLYGKCVSDDILH